jgi:hypothetical protein
MLRAYSLTAKVDSQESCGSNNTAMGVRAAQSEAESKS